MESYESIQRCIAGKTIARAKRLGLSTSLLSKWQEPHTDFTDSGAYNPVDRIETLIDEAVRDGLSAEDSFAPLEYLERKFGRVYLASFPGNLPASMDDLTRELMDTIAEFGRMTTDVAESLADRRISRVERDKIDAHGWKLVKHVVQFLRLVEGSVK